jgi:DNA-binding MarR family transcriptional regulator
MGSIEDQNKSGQNGKGQEQYSFLSKFDTDAVFNSWLLLDFTRFAVSRLRDHELAKIKITPEQAAILQVMARKQGKATIMELSDTWMRRTHSVLTLVRRMEKQGLVKIIKYPRIRTLEIVISDKGWETYNKLNRAPIGKIYSVLSPEEIKQLNGYLRQLLEKARDLLKIIES